jgi:ribosomal protein S8
MSNKSIDTPQNLELESRSNFFAKRKKINEFQDSKLQNILRKIKDKKQFIKEIEDKYCHNDGSVYKPKVPELPVRSSSGMALGSRSQVPSPGIRKYTTTKKTKERYVSRNTNQTSIVKVTPPPRIGEKIPPTFMRKKLSEQRPRNKQPIAPIKTKKVIKKPKEGDKRSHRFLNSWEQGGIAQHEEDIKEDISHDESAFENKRTPREEGSAATRLLESMSKFAGYENYDSTDEEASDYANEESTAQLEKLRNLHQNPSKLSYGNRPYSPPFSQFSGKSKRKNS